MQRLHQNRGAYHGELIDIRRVLKEIESAAAQHGWSTEVFHEHGGFKWLALHRRPLSPDTLHPASRIYISTGIHGDEPAGPLAALQLLRENRWPANAAITLVPCLNPTGFALNRRETNSALTSTAII